MSAGIDRSGPGIGSPWGSVLGVAEGAVERRLELLRQHVLEPLGLDVHAVPGQAQRLGQVQLQQPVMAHQLDGDALAGVGQLGAVVALMLDQAHLGQLLDHGRGRGG